MTLRSRLLDWCHSELQANVKSQKPYPEKNWSPRVAEYFSGCVRDTDGDGQMNDIGSWLSKVGGNWCAASQCAALKACLEPGDDVPHLYRAGVVEIEADARASGSLVTLEQWRSGEMEVEPGDLCLWLRPGGEAWWRHVNRVTEIRRDVLTLETIGGNEHRKWRIASHSESKIDQRLYAFVVHPPTEIYVKKNEPLFSPAQRATLQAQIRESTHQLMLDRA